MRPSGFVEDETRQVLGAWEQLDPAVDLFACFFGPFNSERKKEIKTEGIG